VYSPKIDEDLIPPLYRAAKEDGIPMTSLVSRVLAEWLAQRAIQRRTDQGQPRDPPGRQLIQEDPSTPEPKGGASWHRKTPSSS
jgi:hypothetical protein